MNAAETMAKVANITEILFAAALLYRLGLQTEEPSATVRRYIEANPEIKEVVEKTWDTF